MNLTNQHKALLITLLLTGTVLLSIFNLGLKQQEINIAESFYEIEQEPELTKEELQVLKALERKKNTQAETNKAFNTTTKSKPFTQAYKIIAPPEEYKPEITNFNTEEAINNYKTKYKDITKAEFDDKDLSSYNKVKDILKQQQNTSSNSKSTVSYSLKNRNSVFIPIPVYLCETSGTIVVNITVNSKGDVIDTYTNTSSTSSNACLIEHALQYAKQARFNSTQKKSQIGSITFNFIGK